MTRQIGPAYQLLTLEGRLRHLEAEVARLRLALKILVTELGAPGNGDGTAPADIARRIRDQLPEL